MQVQVQVGAFMGGQGEEEVLYSPAPSVEGRSSLLSLIFWASARPCNHAAPQNRAAQCKSSRQGAVKVRKSSPHLRQHTGATGQAYWLHLIWASSHGTQPQAAARGGQRA